MTQSSSVNHDFTISKAQLVVTLSLEKKPTQAESGQRSNMVMTRKLAMVRILMLSLKAAEKAWLELNMNGETSTINNMSDAHAQPRFCV